MKMKKTALLILTICLLMTMVGCQKNTLDTAGKASENTEQEEAREYGDITDPAQLEALWQEYLLDSANLVGINYGFDHVGEINPLYVARFCWSKYLNEHGEEGLEKDHEGSYLLLFPLDTVLEYARRYFNLNEFDVSQIDAGNYDSRRQAFLFSPGSKKPSRRPSYNEVLLGRKSLERATRNRDGTITAVLVQPDHNQFDRIVYKEIYTLKEREDGSLYFLNGEREYVNNHLVSITGHYRSFDGITGFDENLNALSLVGEASGSLILAYTPYQKEKTASLMLLNPETMTVEKRLDLGSKFQAIDASLKGESIIIRLEDRVAVVDNNLEKLENIPLPGVIVEKIKREPQDGAGNNPVTYFGGYDVSRDRTKYVYADEEGVKLFNALDQSEKLLAETVPITDTDLIDHSFHWQPRFVAGDRKVMTTMTGYESGLGFTLCHLQNDMVETYPIISESVTTGSIRHDTGLMVINTYLHDRENQTGDYHTMYLDFPTGKVHDIQLEDPGDVGFIIPPDHFYVGQDFAAFITFKLDPSDHANNMFYLNRLNLTTMQVEGEVVSVKAADTHLLGVLADGSILFWYDLNPSENGICITG
jgi:hypothetical protein